MPVWGIEVPVPVAVAGVDPVGGDLALFGAATTRSAEIWPYSGPQPPGRRRSGPYSGPHHPVGLTSISL